MHELVHDESRAGHVPAVLHDGNEEVQDKDVGQEHQHAAHACDDAVHHQVLGPSVRHPGRHFLSKPGHRRVYPVHGILADGKRRPENEPQKQDKDGERRPLVGYERVNPVCEGASGTLLLIPLIGLGQGTLDEGILGIHDGTLQRGSHQGLNALLLVGACIGNVLDIAAILLQQLFNIFVTFQVFDGQVSGGVLCLEFLIVSNVRLHMLDSELNLRSVVDVDMPRQFGILVLIDPDNGIEEFGDSFPAAAYRGTHRHTQKVSQLHRVQLISLVAELVVHIERHHHAKVHVNELCGKIEVALDVGSVHHIHHHVRHSLQEVLSNIKLFGGVGRQGIRARKVHERNIVVLEMEFSFLGVYRDAGIIAHVLMGARCNVEQGSFSTVGVSHQGYADVVVPFLGHMGQGFFQPLRLFEVCGQRLQVLVAHQGLAGLLFGNDLNLAGFFPPQGYLVADDFVFNGILERCVQHHPYFLTLDEAHLDEALAETAVSMDADNDRFLTGG